MPTSPINKSLFLSKIEESYNVSYENLRRGTESAFCLSHLSKIYNFNNLIVVQTVDDLPDILFYNSPSGMIYFIDNLSIFAVSSTNKWLTLDGRLIRDELS
jgi:hypothetical protein